MIDFCGSTLKNVYDKNQLTKKDYRRIQRIGEFFYYFSHTV